MAKYTTNLMFSALILFVLGLASCHTTTVDLAEDKPEKTKGIEQKVDSVLALMNIDEKIGQLVQYSGKWDATGPSTSGGDQHKLNKLKNGGVGSMLNIASVASIRETQRD